MDKVWKFLGISKKDEGSTDATNGAKFKKKEKRREEPQRKEEDKETMEDEEVMRKMMERYKRKEEMARKRSEEERLTKKVNELTMDNKSAIKNEEDETKMQDDKSSGLSATDVKIQMTTTEDVPMDVTSDAKPGQVVNEAGGYSYPVKKLDRLKRFIVLGTEGNTYYATEKDRFDENIACVKDLLIEGHVDLLLETLEEYSTQGRVAKEDAILASLMNCVLCNDKEIQQKAYAIVPKICNIPTKLFKFIDICQETISKKREAMEKAGNLPTPQLKKRPRDSKTANVPAESTDISMDPPKKKTKKAKKKEANKLNPNKVFNTTRKRSSGWGRMRRHGISAFYSDPKKDANRLLYLVTKYKNRNNWNHKQVLGYAHPKINKEDDQKQAKDMVLTYCTRGYDGFKKKIEKQKKDGVAIDLVTSEVEAHVHLLEKVKALKPDIEGEEAKLLEHLKNHGIREAPLEFTSTFALPGKDIPTKQNIDEKRVPFQLVREHIPTGFFKSGKVWEAMLQDMPMTALLRNLGTLTSHFLFDKPENLKIVVNAFNNVKRLQRARIHPVKILIALKAYEQGKAGPPDPPRYSFFSRNEKKDERPKPENPTLWRPHQEIIKALDNAFYLSFKQPSLRDTFKTGKRFMLALDVSGSMTFQGCFGCEQITPAVAATALSMVTWNIEEHVEMVAFGGTLEPLEKFGLKKDMQLNQAMSIMRKVNFGSTDCSLPMVYARQKKILVDVFIVYTDSDTGYGRLDPSSALREYRKAVNQDAKLIVMAMTSNGFSIADPEDNGMLDIVGFDTGVPEMISEFVSQKVA